MSDVSISGSDGANAGGTVGLAAISTGYRALNFLLPKAQLYVPKRNSLLEGGVAAAASSVTGKNDNAALAALTKQKKVQAYKAVSSTGAVAKLKQAAGVMPVVTFLAEGLAKTATLSAAMAGSNYNVMEVMYNPKSINFSCTGGGELRGPQNGDAGLSQLTRTSNVSKIKMSVELIFEDIDSTDAFFMDGFEMNGEAAAKLLKSSVVRIGQLAGGTGFSIKKQCDGLLSLLSFKKLQQVVFVWSDMFFHGELTNVDVKYEMFNRFGNPILGRVRLTIEQNDSEKSIRYASDEQQWNDAIDLAFRGRSLIK